MLAYSKNDSDKFNLEAIDLAVLVSNNASLTIFALDDPLSFADDLLFLVLY